MEFIFIRPLGKRAGVLYCCQALDYLIKTRSKNDLNGFSFLEFKLTLEALNCMSGFDNHKKNLKL